MRTSIAIALQICGMTLPAVGLYRGLTQEHGMGPELTLLFIGIGLFLAGRMILPADSGAP